MMHAKYFGPWASIRGYIGISNKSIMYDPPITCTRFMVRGRQWTENTCIHFQEYTFTKNQEVGFLDIWSGVISTLVWIFGTRKMDFFNFSPFIYDNAMITSNLWWAAPYPTLRFLFSGLLIDLLPQNFNCYAYLAEKCVQRQSILSYFDIFGHASL